MTYVLHGARGSGSCAVECVLAEIGAGYELRELSLRDDEQQGAEYSSINPHCKVPSLVIDDGPVLTESVAILLTLDERHPEAALLPAKGTPARAQALRWLLFSATEIYPIVEINDYPERFATDPDQIDAMRERAREIWRTRWLVVDRTLEPFEFRDAEWVLIATTKDDDAVCIHPFLALRARAAPFPRASAPAATGSPVPRSPLGARRARAR